MPRRRPRCRSSGGRCARSWPPSRWGLGATTTRPSSPAEDELRDAVATLVRGWEERLRATLLARHGEEEGERLAARYARAFSGAYRAAVAVERAADDVVLLDAAAREGVRVVLCNETATTTALRFYLARAPLVLSEFMPVLENLGLRVLAEDQEEGTPAGAPRHAVQTLFRPGPAGRRPPPRAGGARAPAPPP